jgi:hypothetical protein
MHKKLFLGLGFNAMLSGCYFVNQTKFDDSVHSWVSVNMPFATAISILGQHGMACSGGNPASCARIRGGLQPYSCMERVNVHFAEPWMLVDRIEIPKIACGGL